MLKYFFILLLVAIIGFGFWFWQLSGPQKLNYADRWYPGETQLLGQSSIGIEYGKKERQKLDIYQPADGENHPVLIFFHGGAWYHGEREGYAFLARAFAARGFVTVIADYRKYPDVKFPDFVEDTADAIAWTHASISAHNGDPKRIFIMGHSAGAHLSMLAALDPQWLARKNLDSSIIKGVVGLAGPFDFLPMEEGGTADQAMGDWPRPKETQPISYARGDGPPLLLLQGSDDRLVGAHNSENLQAATQAAGGSALYKLYDGVDHYEIIMAVARPFRRKAPVIDDVIAFITAQRAIAAQNNS